MHSEEYNSCRSEDRVRCQWPHGTQADRVFTPCCTSEAGTKRHQCCAHKGCVFTAPPRRVPGGEGHLQVLGPLAPKFQKMRTIVRPQDCSDSLLVQQKNGDAHERRVPAKSFNGVPFSKRQIENLPAGGNKQEARKQITTTRQCPAHCQNPGVFVCTQS